jgi:aspartyl/asparaginyl-tRNA synthetase
MIEPEICFIGLEELFGVVESSIKYTIKYCFENIMDDLIYFNKLYKIEKKERLKKMTI